MPQVRCESMSAAAKMGRPHGMLSVVGLSDADLDKICAEVRGLGKPACGDLAHSMLSVAPSHCACIQKQAGRQAGTMH